MADASTQCYYLDSARNQQGPVAAADVARLIRSGTINRDTLMWYPGMADWRPASQISEFASLFSGPPPMRPPMAPGGAAAMRAPAPAAAGYGDYDQHAGGGFEAPKSVGFGDAIAICFRKYVTFSGRAGRPEFWWWALFELLVLIVAVAVDAFLFHPQSGVGPIYGLSILALLLPGLAVTVRRLHDTDRSGWWILLGFIPFGGIVLLVFYCLRGTEGPNRFGPQVAV
jgi:uncharacterized membrane protein YhaH (DUF805 family)